MLSREDYMFIEAQLKRGVYKKDIAEELGVHPRTISRAMKNRAAPKGKRPRAHKSKLDPYKSYVDQLLGEGVWNAGVILSVIRERGYTGGYSILRDYIHPKRTMHQGRKTVRFETAPGVQMQNDWGEIWGKVSGERRKVSFSINTLGYSRRFHFWCTDRQDAEHTYEGIIRAFEHFGGVTKELLVDNQKSLVVSNRIREGVRYHEAFVDLAGHYGFLPRACRPYRARTKGKDERMVQYVKNNFFQRYRSFESFEHMNNLALVWLGEEADQRFHGTVKEVVIRRFAREREHLLPLPPTRFDTSYRVSRWVNWDGLIDVRGNRYSVPDEYRGKNVVVRIGLDGFFTVYSGEKKITEHRLTPASEGWVTVPEHHASLWRETLSVQKRELSVYEEVARCN